MGNTGNIDVYVYIYTPDDEIKEILTSVDYADLSQGLSFTLPEDCLLLMAIDGRDMQISYPLTIGERFVFSAFGFNFDLMKRTPRQSYRKKGDKVDFSFQE